MLDYHGLEDKKYIEKYIQLQGEINGMNKILSEMAWVLLKSQSKSAAAKTLRSKWIPKMNVKLDGTKAALAQWMTILNSVKE